MRRTLRLGKDARRKVHSPPASDRSGRSASRAAAAAAGAAAATTSSAAATSASEQQGWAAAAAAAASWRSMAAWATDGSHTCPASAFCTRSHGAGRDASQPHGDASAVASLCPASGTPRGIPTARASIPSYAPPPPPPPPASLARDSPPPPPLPPASLARDSAAAVRESGRPWQLRPATQAEADAQLAATLALSMEFLLDVNAQP